MSTRRAWVRKTLFATLLSLACESSSGGPSDARGGTAGATNGGGTATNGGGTATNGGTSSGGAKANGGTISTGGLASGGAKANGGTAAELGGRAASGGATNGGTANGGAKANGGTTSSGGASSSTACDDPSLVWKSANKTNYTSYPDPNSEECIKYNGCTWAGQFAGCNGVKSEAWVSEHDIVAAFPDFATLKLHRLCLRKGSKTLVVTVLDTCGDSDCDGCCTENKGSANQLIDIESYTNTRWGVPDGPIEWADLGRAPGDPCL